MVMTDPIIQNTFFVVWYFFGDWLKVFWAFLFLVGVFGSIIYQMTRR